MTFPVMSDLSALDRAEIERIQSIDSGLRTTRETAFLTARAPYLTNEISLKDASGLILQASGLTVPEGYTGFKKGALFIKTNDEAVSLRVNVGDEDSAEWRSVTHEVPEPEE